MFEQLYNFREKIGNTKQLDVFLVNEPQLWIEITVEKNLGINTK